MWLTNLWNMMIGQHRLRKLGQVQGGVVICHARDRHFLVITASCITQTSHCSYIKTLLHSLALCSVVTVHNTF